MSPFVREPKPVRKSQSVPRDEDASQCAYGSPEVLTWPMCALRLLPSAGPSSPCPSEYTPDCITIKFPSLKYLIDFVVKSGRPAPRRQVYMCFPSAHIFTTAMSPAKTTDLKATRKPSLILRSAPTSVADASSPTRGDTREVNPRSSLASPLSSHATSATSFCRKSSCSCRLKDSSSTIFTRESGGLTTFSRGCSSSVTTVSRI